MLKDIYHKMSSNLQKVRQLVKETIDMISKIIKDEIIQVKTKQDIHARSVDAETRKKDFIYLSELKSLFERYNLTYQEEESFSKLRQELLKDGEKNAIEEIRLVFSRDEQDLSRKSKNVIDKYKSITEEIKKNISKVLVEKPEYDIKSPKLYPESVRSYLRELSLEDDARKEFSINILQRVLSRIYNIGRERVIGRIEVDVQLLAKYLEDGNKEGIQRKLDEIEKALVSMIQTSQENHV